MLVSSSSVGTFPRRRHWDDYHLLYLGVLCYYGKKIDHGLRLDSDINTMVLIIYFLRWTPF